MRVRNTIITRTVYSEIPMKVVYELSELGESLMLFSIRCASGVNVIYVGKYQGKSDDHQKCSQRIGS
ncbi:winged helix-turn-helix transcriptional regulator [Brevibacillus antibioticus]|uniref:winged helix-turn-helix transcriptional regulator n=1 Tax=Brevibacillus antibioticus TaxID=2570228 RepID=UPI003CC50D07